ncbi:MAG: tetratricopeptide repeat protein [Gemmatimonadota bacterium]
MPRKRRRPTPSCAPPPSTPASWAASASWPPWRGTSGPWAGGGRVVFLAGEAGVGKTRLVEEVCRRVRLSGARATWGTCYYGHGLGALMPILDAVGHLFAPAEGGLTEAERSALQVLLERQAPELAPLAGSNHTTVKVRAAFSAAFGTEESPEAARQQLFDTLYDLLATAAAQRPLVVVLEDVHWADAGTVELLGYLARRASECPLLVVVTYRPEELAGPEAEASLARLLAQLNVDGRLEEVSLPRLSRPELLQMARSLFLEADFGEDFAEYLHGQSQGNPFIALEILKLLHGRRVLHCEEGLWSLRPDFAESVIPERVGSLILQRVDQLDPAHREVLQLAAVIGPRFTSADLEAALGTSRLDLLKILFHLERDHRLIAGERGIYEFSHSKIREVLYIELSWELRREYHRIAAAVLTRRAAEGQAVHATELGRHLFFAEEWRAARPHLRRAADEAYQLFAWREAGQLYDQVAVAGRQAGEQSDDVYHALRCGGRCCANLAAYDRARERFAEMQQSAARHDRPADEAEAWYQLGWLERRQRRFEAAAAAFEQAEILCLRHPGEAVSRIRARALISRGAVDFECGRYDEARTRWQEALALVAEAPGPEAANAVNNLAVLATVHGDFDEAWRQYERALELDVGRPATTQTVLTYHNMGMLRADQQRWDEALALFDRSLELCHERRLLAHEPVIEMNRGEALIGRGDLAEARVALSRALRAFRRLDDPVGMADALRLYGCLCRREQNWNESRDYLERSVEINRQIGESVSLGEALYELGALHRAAGQPAAAVPALREAEGIFRKAEARPDLERVQALLQEICPG